jgi:hypothetical protein
MSENTDQNKTQKTINEKELEILEFWNKNNIKEERSRNILHQVTKMLVGVNILVVYFVWAIFSTRTNDPYATLLEKLDPPGKLI